MTQEQGRLKELPVQFPRVPQGEFARKSEEFLASSFDSVDLISKVDKITPWMVKKDPQLAGFLYHFSLGCDEPGSFRYGVIFTWYILDSLELPEVSLDTIKKFSAEHKSGHELLKQEANKYISEGLEAFTPEQLGDVEEKIRFLEFIQESHFPTPQDYYEENPDLMNWIDSQPVWIRTGSLDTYELKRRQFFADQLLKQFGKDLGNRQ